MISSPYLQAIQDVSGSTPGEKYRTLNNIARRIIKESDVKDKTIQVQSSLELPEILIPLVDLEIGKIIRDPDRIVEALKSDDTVIFNRAIRVKWFFDGTFETVTNVTYFQDHIFDWVSVTNRLKLIKTLSTQLATKKKSHIAEEFYLALSDMYGSAQAEALLYACSESFTWDKIITRQLVLTARTVENLFLKHPDVVIKYLKLSEPSDKPYDRSMHKIPMERYFYFSIHLVKNHTDAFVDLIKSMNYLPITLGRNSTAILLKKKIDIIIENSRLFGLSMNLKFISSKLTKEQFKLFFRNLFPIKTSESSYRCSFTEMYYYLEYYPSSERMPLFLSTFEEVYEESFFEQDELLTPKVLLLLSPEDRVHVARRKIEENPEWFTDYWAFRTSWRCYLPIDESISIFKDKIGKTSSSKTRCVLLRQLIYSCKVNNDEDALLKVLEYIVVRHKNERITTLVDIIALVVDEFEIQNLSHEHWKILDRFINILRREDHLYPGPYAQRKYFQRKVHFNLIHGLPITEPIKFLCSHIEHCIDYDWNILKEHPAYERKCLEQFLEVAPSFRPKEGSEMYLIDSFLNSITDFNERILKTGSEVEPITIKSEWLLAQIPLFINSDKAGNMRFNLKKYDAKLYKAWVVNKKDTRMVNYESTKDYNEWKKYPERIAKHWERYLQECETGIHRKCARRFIKLCRWHQNIPIKFADNCLKDVTENRNPQALIVLSILFEGPVIEHLISDLLPNISMIDIEAENGKENCLMMKSIPKALSVVNPPVSLNVTAQLCKHDTIHMIANWLEALSRRTSVAKLIPFITTFMDQPISISKHFTRMFSTAANINECHRVYINLWRNEKHQTIRTLVFKKIFQLFVSNANDKTWLLITECIDNLTTNDKDPLDSIFNLEEIPNSYVADYVQKLFKTLSRFSDVVVDGDHVDPELIWSHTAELLRLPNNVAFLFPEELHQEILTTYFTDFSLPIEVLTAAQYYLINAYINPALDKLESRLKFHSDMFVDILENQWDAPDPQRPNSFPANHMVDSQMITILYHFEEEEIRAKFIDITLKSFLSVLHPSQAPSFFSFYTFAFMYRYPDMSLDQYGEEIMESMPVFVELFGEGFIPTLGPLLGECLKLFYGKYGKHDENIQYMIESLLELGNDLTTLLAIRIPIPEYIKMDDEYYTDFLQILCQQENKVAIATAATYINRRGFENIS